MSSALWSKKFSDNLCLLAGAAGHMCCLPAAKPPVVLGIVLVLG